MIDITDINQRMCSFALARLASMGEEASGLYNYYAYLAREGRILRPEEIAVAQFLWSRKTSILEICAGAAQLGHLLSLDGHAVAAVEIDMPRADFAVALGAHVGSSCRVLRGAWQGWRPFVDWQVIVTINAVTSHIQASDIELIKEHARRGGEFIMRPRQFGPGLPVEIPGLKATQVHEDIYHYRT